MKRFAGFLLLGILLAAVSWGGWYFLQSRQRGLKVQVAVSASEEFLREWGGQTYRKEILFPRLETAFPGQVLYVAFLVSGYGLDEQGSTRLTGDFFLIGPDGRILIRNEKSFGHREGVGSFGTDGVLILEPVTQLVFDSGDPFGPYRIRGVVRDEAGGRSGVGEHQLRLRPIREILKQLLAGVVQW
ncbi:MAG: hypothetical protein COV76_07550 [Candidatus Omnitrophica bacterium CG11_big_fil_rev_8_21_14_0_20_64_10]|nr:MAG: hypothetical protein COV76_07550 [Candidatus Omnitrophica bacterium CG11_big_fil_rev_8_21_14_0_20_64_10]